MYLGQCPNWYQGYKNISEYFVQGHKKVHCYFDVEGAQIYQTTWFRGVQNFFFTLMLRAHKHFRIFYKGVQIIIIVLMSGKYKVFKTFYLARYPTDTLFWCQGCTNISEHFILGVCKHILFFLLPSRILFNFTRLFFGIDWKNF